MLRLVIIRTLLFLLPFVIYAFWLVLRREKLFEGRHWRELLWLSVIGIVLSFVVFGVIAENAGSRLSGRNTPAVSAPQ